MTRKKCDFRTYLKQVLTNLLKFLNVNKKFKHVIIEKAMKRIRLKKSYPSGTFIPFPQRFMAIIQLCIAFSVILWTFSQPFMGEYFSIRSRLLLYEYVLGESSLLEKQGLENKLIFNKHLFNQLQPQEQADIYKHKKEIESYAKRPLLNKLWQGCHYLLFNMPLFEQEWMVLAIASALCILMKVDGAKLAVWLLPIVSLANGINHQYYYPAVLAALDEHLFPSENLIFSQYIDEPLPFSMKNQKTQLEQGWHNYLLKHWLPVSLAYQNMSKHQKVEASEFYFTLARIKELQKQTFSSWLHPKPSRSNILLLLVGFLWNCFAAWVMSGFKINQIKSYFNFSKQTESLC